MVNPTLKSVEKDRDTTLVCSASGYPEPVISWLKDYIPVNLSDSHIKIMQSGRIERNICHLYLKSLMLVD